MFHLMRRKQLDLIDEVVKRWHAVYMAVDTAPPAPPAPPAATGPGTLTSSNVKLEKPEKYDSNAERFNQFDIFNGKPFVWSLN